METKKKPKLFIRVLKVLLVIVILGRGYSYFNGRVTWKHGKLMVQAYQHTWPSQLKITYFDENLKKTSGKYQSNGRPIYVDTASKVLIQAHQSKSGHYKLNNKLINTSQGKDDIVGATNKTVTNDKYQIGIEQVFLKELANSKFSDTTTKIVNIQTLDSVIIEGMLSYDVFIGGDYLYGFTYDSDHHVHLVTVDLQTMQPWIEDVENLKINFIYEKDRNVYATSSTLQTGYILDGASIINGGKIVEDKSAYLNIPIPEYPGNRVFKNIGDVTKNQNKYVIAKISDVYVYPEKEINLIVGGTILTFNDATLQLTDFTFSELKVSQIHDVTSMLDDKIAVLYQTYDSELADDRVKTFISIFDKNGVEIEKQDISKFSGSHGRFEYLDYLE